jgi:hypothetical protein
MSNAELVIRNGATQSQFFPFTFTFTFTFMVPPLFLILILHSFRHLEQNAKDPAPLPAS